MDLSLKFEEALVYANRIHAGQIRKKTEMPFIAHLIGVTSIVLEHGGNETEAIGALLHDAVEDAGGETRLEEIRLKFGEAVAAIVAGCTDSMQVPPPPWRERKEAYLRHLPEATRSTQLVSAADKLHNGRALIRMHRLQGDAIFERFVGGREGTLWYFQSLAGVFNALPSTPLTEELDRVVRELQAMTSS
ncbi:MAG: HD domain-containing protein [Verrucomicrobia bacterium]|nr:HD domain-containing protein [Verrucomicrobiota bacterium]